MMHIYWAFHDYRFFPIVQKIYVLTMHSTIWGEVEIVPSKILAVSLVLQSFMKSLNLQLSLFSHLWVITVLGLCFTFCSTVEVHGTIQSWGLAHYGIKWTWTLLCFFFIQNYKSLRALKRLWCYWTRFLLMTKTQEGASL